MFFKVLPLPHNHVRSFSSLPNQLRQLGVPCVPGHSSEYRPQWGSWPPILHFTIRFPFSESSSLRKWDLCVANLNEKCIENDDSSYLTYFTLYTAMCVHLSMYYLICIHTHTHTTSPFEEEWEGSFQNAEVLF